MTAKLISSYNYRKEREMKIVVLIARILLGLVFLVFGLNGFLNFLSMGPMPTGLAGQFMGALFLSHYYWVVAALQIVGGLLLLINRFVPLALVLLGPVIVNILCYHLFLNHAGAPLAIVVTALWFVVFYGRRQYFAGIFSSERNEQVAFHGSWQWLNGRLSPDTPPRSFVPGT
jgi:putative oxidoreductase